jgi:hypothetical protein
MEGIAIGYNFERDRHSDHSCQVWLNLVRRFRGEDLNVIFYQNMPNLHNRYKSAKRKISHKNSLPYSCSYNLSSFWHILKQQWTSKIAFPLFSIFCLAGILVGRRDHRTQIWKGAIQGQFHQSLVAIGPVVSEEKINMWNVDRHLMKKGK